MTTREQAEIAPCVRPNGAQCFLLCIGPGGKSIVVSVVHDSCTSITSPQPAVWSSLLDATVTAARRHVCLAQRSRQQSFSCDHQCEWGHASHEGTLRVLTEAYLRLREAINRILEQDDDNGQGMVEYALILVLIAVVVIVILTVVGKKVTNVFSNISSHLGT